MTKIQSTEYYSLGNTTFNLTDIKIESIYDFKLFLYFVDMKKATWVFSLWYNVHLDSEMLFLHCQKLSFNQ